MQNNSNKYFGDSYLVDGNFKAMEIEFADEICVVDKKIKNWSLIFADKAIKCIEYGLLDDGLRFLDLALTEKYLEMLKKVTNKNNESIVKKEESKRDRLLRAATFDDKISFKRNYQNKSFKSKL